MTIDASKQLLSLVDNGNCFEMNTLTIIICIFITYTFITRYKILVLRSLRQITDFNIVCA